MDINRIVYQLTIEDLQTVAEAEINRELTEEEIKLVENKLGDYIAWHESISDTINELKIE
jgi:hypothetical protein